MHKLVAAVLLAGSIVTVYTEGTAKIHSAIISREYKTNLYVVEYAATVDGKDGGVAYKSNGTCKVRSLGEVETTCLSQWKIANSIK